MNKKRFNRFLATVFCASCISVAGVQSLHAVEVHINSGNPAFPFPQFVSYQYGNGHNLKNLGTDNPEGVVHAEMEQDIRDAYQIFANEWIYTGESHGGVKYIKGNEGCPYDCREGDGYSLLAAAIMGDKVSFDGLWMRLHDNFRNKEPRYIDGVVPNPNYAYGDYSIKDNADAATDGDVDIALALYIAWRQWGDFMGIDGANGQPISYKKEMIDVIHGFVHLQTRFPTDGEPRRYLTGEIGLDGYLKNGNTWPEFTDVVTNNPITVDGVLMRPEFAGPNKMHSDYMAPAYFHEFFELLNELKTKELSEFEINQFKRCAASCDWIVGNWIGQNAKNIFFGEEVSISGTTVTLEAGNQGGRFRSTWRTALNYMWHGNPDYSWDPVTQQVVNGGNSYEFDASKRFSDYMNDPQGWGGGACTKFGGPLPLTFKGPATLHWDIQPDGSDVNSKFTFNWIPGAGMASAVSAQDMDLIGLLYRQSNIEWDVSKGNDGYLSSLPVYFHGFFRLLGMLVATGNHIAPSQMATPVPNLKIYRSLRDSLSFAYTGDTIRYYLDYRNFGTVDAKGVKIVEKVPNDFVFVSATNGGVYDASTHTITWNLGTVSGFKSDDIAGPALDKKAPNLKKTMGQVSYVARVGSEAFGRYCTTAEITCSNGDSWVTNEYPNHVTATMQRNCVDVIKRALKIEKTANVEKVNPGNLVKYTVKFENSSEAGWLDGGRPRVNFGFANSGTPVTGQQWLKFRLYNDAIEPYIDYGNYRISYYMYDSNLKCVVSDADCPVGWGWYTAVYEGKRTASDEIKVTHEKVVEGSDEKGKWNQRISLQFSPLLVTTSAHISNYYGMGSRIHRGGTETLRAYGYIFPSTWSDSNFGDDWSWDANAADEDDGLYFPVTPSWQEIDPLTGKSIENPVTEYLPSACEVAKHTIDNILVEEYDGYVWRRILGNGPMAGREANNVVVIDTLPKGMTFVQFENKCPLEEYGASWDSYQIADGRWVVKWEIPTMQVKQKGTIIYTAEADFPSGKKCDTDDEDTENVAWIVADLNSPLSDTAIVTVTCAKVPDPILPTTLVKVSDKEKYQVGDDITYTIEYEQTHGAVFDKSEANASDWDLKGSSAGTSISIGDKSEAKHKWSYSKNAYIETNASLTKYSSTEIFFRDNIRLRLRADWATLKLECYDGSTLLKDAEIVFQNTDCVLRFNLNEEILQVWLDNDTTTSASFVVDNLKTLTAGYFGFRGIEAGNYSYTNIRVHTDYAYDLSIIDRKPEEITFVSADEGGVLQGDSIVWKFEHGINNPIPFGKKYTVTWTGKVDECNESIINIAYAKLLGHADNEIMAQAVSECGDSGCSITDVEITSAVDKFCYGDSVMLAAIVEPKGIYYYEFMLDGKSLGKRTKNNKFYAVEGGKYTVVVYDTADSTCNMKSKPITLDIDSIPAFDLGKDVVICKGETVNLDTKLDASVIKFEWSDGSVAESLAVVDSGMYVVKAYNDVCEVYDSIKVTVADELVVDLGNDTTVCAGASLVLDAGDKYDTYEWQDGSTGSSFSVIKSGQYSVKVTQGACSGGGLVNVMVSQVTDPDGTLKSDYLISDTVAGGKFGKDILQNSPDAVVIENGYVYKWYSADTVLLNDTPTPEVPKSGNAVYTYFVSRVNADGCESDTVKVIVTVTGAPVPKVEDIELCSGVPANALDAKVTEDGSNSNWSLVWYDVNGNKLPSAPVPDNSVPGEVTYYVSQISDAGVESAKVPLKVTTYGVAVPSVDKNRTSYCSGELLGQLIATSNYDESNFIMKGDFVWSVNGSQASGVPVVGSKVETTTYTVKEVYALANGDVCESKEAVIDIVVTTVPEPSGDLVVNYLKKEASSGFVSLTEKNPNVALAEDSTKTLVWYDDKGNMINGVPVPVEDPNWKAGENAEIHYYVEQVDINNGCKSEKVLVKVVISDSPMPKASRVAYCQGDVADRLDAEITDSGDGTVYELVWYEEDGVTERSDAPVPNTTVPGKKSYYVAQREVGTANISSKTVIDVMVHELPELEVSPLDPVCGGTVSLSNAFSLVNKNLSVINKYYVGTDTTMEIKNGVVDKTSAYSSIAYYVINSTVNKTKRCESEMKTTDVYIHNLENLVVRGDSAVCPGGSIKLVASAESDNPGSEQIVYQWSGNASGKDSIYTELSVKGNFGDEKEYIVTASVGACSGKKALTKKHKVTVSTGILDGGVFANGKADKYLTCGDEQIELSTTHSGSDFAWYDISGNKIGSGEIVSITPEKSSSYVLEHVNVCLVRDTVLVEVRPLTVTADLTDLNKIVCLKDKATAVLTIEGYDPKVSGSYIKWYKDGVELAKYAGNDRISIGSADAADAGVYSYSVSNGVCVKPENKDTAVLKVTTPAKYVKPENLSVCYGNSLDVKLDVKDTDAEVLWEDGEVGPDKVVSPENSSRYEFTVSQPGGCSQKDFVYVAVEKPADVTLPSDTVICRGESVSLLAVAIGKNLKYYWKADGSDEVLTYSPNITVTPSETTVYTFTVSGTSCSDIVQSVEVEVAMLPVIDTIVERGIRKVEVISDNGIGAEPYLFNLDGGEYVEDNLFLLKTYGKHIYTIKDANGCVGTMAHIFEAPSISIPSVFTPGGDGVEDVWEVPDIAETYPNAVITIFDRFGKQLVQMKGSDGGWDGTYNGHRMPSTDYWYEINIEEIDKIYIGHFTLISE